MTPREALQEAIDHYIELAGECTKNGQHEAAEHNRDVYCALTLLRRQIKNLVGGGMNAHPLSTRTNTRTGALDASQVKLYRRPRFTPGEALVLNLLVNADGRTVTLPQIKRSMTVYMGSFSYSDAAVYQYIYKLRAKLGDTFRRPEIIVNTTTIIKGQRIAGWSYREPTS